MIHWKFPAHLVAAGSRVILYGAGAVGKSYRLQIATGMGYSLLFTVDRDWERLGNGVEDPERLRKMPTGDYDAVVIAIKNRTARVTARAYLLGLGVPKGKIVVPDAFPAWPSSPFSLEDLFAYGRIPEGEMRDFEAYGAQDVRFFEALTEGMRTYPGGKEELLERLEPVLESADWKEKMILLRGLFVAGCASPETTRAQMELAMALRDPEEAFWLARTVYIQIAASAPCLYDRFYPDCRALYRKIAEDAGWRYTSAGGWEPSNKIAILTPYFHSGTASSPAKTIRDTANPLAALGYQVCIFVSDDYTWDGRSLLEPLDCYARSTSRAEENAAALDPRIEIRYAPDVCVRERMQTVLDDVAGWNPGVILELTESGSAVSGVYYGKTPSMALPIYDQDCASFFDKMSVLGRHRISRYTSFTQEQAVFLPCLSLREEDMLPRAAYTRGELGFGEEDCLIITVGTRLRAEIGETLADAVRALLEEVPAMRWLVVGDGLSAPLREKYAALIAGRRIVLHGYEEDLPALYRLCDICLNPDRVGGGLSIVTAMYAGLPVVTPLTARAGEAFAGTDWAVDGEERELAARIRRLCEDPAYYAAASSAMRERAVSFLPENFARALAGALEDLMAGWEASI